MLLVGQKIAEKVFKNNKPTKFPPVEPNGPAHIILVDMRGYDSGHADLYDYIQIALGSRYVQEPMAIMSWPDKSGTHKPILGLFEKGNPLKAAATLQERIHMIGFVSEKKYMAGEIKDLCHFIGNKDLFANEEEAKNTLFFRK